MCDTCGCNITPGNEHLLEQHGHLHTTESGRESVEVLKGLLDANDHQALHNREHFDHHGVLAVNLMSSPGAGKTSLLEATIEALDGVDDDVQLCERLIEDAGVALVPGTGFGAPGYLRLSYATSTEVLEEALDRIDRCLASA